MEMDLEYELSAVGLKENLSMRKLCFLELQSKSLHIFIEAFTWVALTNV